MKNSLNGQTVGYSLNRVVSVLSQLLEW
jgi:hypothetical protein